MCSLCAIHSLLSYRFVNWRITKALFFPVLPRFGKENMELRHIFYCNITEVLLCYLLLFDLLA